MGSQSQIEVEPCFHNSPPTATAQTLAPNVQDGSDRIRDILASLLESGRKWRRVIHLCIQSMEKIPSWPEAKEWTKKLLGSWRPKQIWLGFAESLKNNTCQHMEYWRVLWSRLVVYPDRSALGILMWSVCYPLIQPCSYWPAPCKWGCATVLWGCSTSLT